METKTVININTGSSSDQNVSVKKTKRCSRCGRELPATPEYFHRDTRRSNGLASICKECKSEYAQEYNKKHVRLPVEIVPDLFKPSKAPNETDDLEGAPDVRSTNSVLRKCKVCGKYKPLSIAFFYKNASCLGGYELTCKSCRRDQRRERMTLRKQRVAMNIEPLTRNDISLESVSDEDLISELGRRGYSGELTFSRKLVI